MIKSISIERLRGIHQGKVEGLDPLSVFVGPNGSGKSTVLDAVLIAQSPDPGDAVGRAVRRRLELRNEARWLLWRRGDAGPAKLRSAGTKGEHHCTLTWRNSPAIITGSLDRSDDLDFVICEVVSNGEKFVWEIDFSDDVEFESRFVSSERPKPGWANFTRLVESPSGAAHAALAEVYTSALRRGRLTDAKEIIKAVIPDLTDLLIVTDRHGKAVVDLVYDWGSVPVAAASDGQQALVRLCLELATVPKDGIALLEEPESHQHPSAIFQTAKAIVATVRAGIQVILATHSLELIDALIHHATDADLAQMSVHALRLNAGILDARRLNGTEAKFERNQIAEDLR